MNRGLDGLRSPPQKPREHFQRGNFKGEWLDTGGEGLKYLLSWFRPMFYGFIMEESSMKDYFTEKGFHSASELIAW